jgi:hypothetical protein
MSDSLFNKTALAGGHGQQNALNAQVYSQRDLWYFRTGDGNEVGPFRYRSEAETGLERFLATLKERLQP